MIGHDLKRSAQLSYRLDNTEYASECAKHQNVNMWNHDAQKLAVCDSIFRLHCDIIIIWFDYLQFFSPFFT